MKRLPWILGILTVAFQSSFAESYPGYRYPAVFSGERIANDNPDFATIFARLTYDALTFQDVAIYHELKTRKVVSARWMAKGNFEFLLPKMGLYVPPKPAEEKRCCL